MRPRTELALGSALVLALGVGAGLVGLSRERLTDADRRRSTFLSGPAGARGFAEALERLGVRVETFRLPAAALDSAAPPRTLTVFVGPSRDLNAGEGRTIADSGAISCSRVPVPRRRSAVSAGMCARVAGTRSRPRGPRHRGASFPGCSRRAPAASIGRGSGLLGGGGRGARDLHRPGGADRGHAAPDDRRPVVALRAALVDGRTITLVADDALFTNRALRETGAGPFALGLVVPRYDRVIVDEYHHGYDASRSLGGATFDWTLHSPWGWAILQLAVVGVLALLAAGRSVRAGPLGDRTTATLAAGARARPRHRARGGPRP